MFAVLFTVFVFLNEAMIWDTKHFCQSTHFQVLHYTQNKYLKKTFTKLKNAYNASLPKSWMGGKRPELGLVIMMGFRELERCSPSGVTSVMQYKHKNHPGQTEEAVITHKGLHVYLYICIQRPGLNYFNKYKEIQLFILSAVSPRLCYTHHIENKRKTSPLVTQGS